MTSFKVTSWNINSVRLRIDQVTRFLDEQSPDVLCLQETKCPNGKFPHKALKDAGYDHIAINGQNGYNGVCIAARQPFVETSQHQYCADIKEDSRHIQATFENGVTVYNFYVPAGGDEPDVTVNEKFDHKMRFLAEMKDIFSKNKPKKSVLVGDLNIAPHENDVWSHKQLLKVVSHTPIEVEALEALRLGGEWLDVARELYADDEKLFSWWSYRSKDWRASNRGRRLDHIWLSADLRDNMIKSGKNGFEIFDAARSWERPSDHAPLSFEFDV